MRPAPRSTVELDCTLGVSVYSKFLIVFVRLAGKWMPLSIRRIDLLVF